LAASLLTITAGRALSDWSPLGTGSSSLSLALLDGLLLAGVASLTDSPHRSVEIPAGALVHGTGGGHASKMSAIA
jgi:hypothetical protein